MLNVTSLVRADALKQVTGKSRESVPELPL